MELLFLGTASGTPTKTRNVSGLALRTSGTRGWALVDCGEGTQHQVLHTSLSLIDLRAVFITHLHGDHCYGLPGLLASAGMLNRAGLLHVVGPAPLADYLRGVMDTTELRLPYPIAFVDVTGLADTAVLPDLAVSATRLSHRIPSYAYTFTERSVERKLDGQRLAAAGVPPGPAWGRLQQGVDVALDDGTILRAEQFLLPPRAPLKVVVGGDNDTPDLLAAQASGADLLVHEATYTEPVLRKVGPGPQHSSALRVGQMAERAGVPNLVLTHFSPRYQRDGVGQTMADLEAEARAAYSGQLFLADDFARYVLGRDGRLAAVGDVR